MDLKMARPLEDHTTSHVLVSEHFLHSARNRKLILEINRAPIYFSLVTKYFIIFLHGVFLGSFTQMSSNIMRQLRDTKISIRQKICSIKSWIGSHYKD